MASSIPLHLQHTHLRLKSDGGIEKLNFDKTFWPRVMNGELGTFHGEYLVTCSVHDRNWPSWERHPNGDEIVLLMSGSANFLLESPDGIVVKELRHPGEFVFVPRGCWHTANVLAPTSLVFITAGEGTQGRPRESLGK